MERAKGNCEVQQKEYMQCMRTWFNEKFLKGELIPNSDCELPFEQFRDCVALHFQKVRRPLPTRKRAAQEGHGRAHATRMRDIGPLLTARKLLLATTRTAGGHYRIQEGKRRAKALTPTTSCTSMMGMDWLVD
jgi:hypothetical protein